MLNGPNHLVAQYTCIHPSYDRFQQRFFFPASYWPKNKHTLHLESTAVLSDFIQIRSIQYQEHKAAQFLSNLANDKQLISTFIESPDSTTNLAISLFPFDLQKPNFIFLFHMDVVDAFGDWVYPPFSGHVDDEFIWGRGAYDNKGPLIAGFMALAEIRQRAVEENWDCNITLLCLAGEERFAKGGARYVAENYLQILNPVLFIGEGPAGLAGVSTRNAELPLFSIAVTSKRALWLRLSLDYSSNGHGAVPPGSYPGKDMVKAVNNLLRAKPALHFDKYNSTLLSVIGDQEKGWKGFMLKNIHVLHPLARGAVRKDPLYAAFFTNTVSLTQFITSGLDQNSIPSKVEAYLDCRLLPQTDTEEFIQWVRKKIKNPSIGIDVIKETPAAPVTSPHRATYDLIVDAVKTYFPESAVASIMLPATNDSNFFRAAGFPVYCIIPFVMTPELLKNIHAANERLPLGSFFTGIDIYQQMMSGFAAYSKEKK
jgi:carboxypeptidase PM20D1